MQADEILAAHNVRLRSIDGYLPDDGPLPDDAIGDSALLVTPNGRALATVDRIDPASPHATWAAAEEHRLMARVADVGAMSGLLPLWDERVATLAPDRDDDSQAVILWPSRDAPMTPMFRGLGLVPQAILACRPMHRPDVITAEDDVRVRPLRSGDIDRAIELYLAEVAWDHQFNGMVERPSTEMNARNEFEAALVEALPWTWVAEVGDDLVGVLIASAPEHSGWIAHRCAAQRVAYISIMMVDARHRSRGVGAALVRHVHTAFAERGVGAVLLHYAALSPLSGPFWHRCGYRPLWTSWARRPAWASRPAGHDRLIP